MFISAFVLLESYAFIIILGIFGNIVIGSSVFFGWFGRSRHL